MHRRVIGALALLLAAIMAPAWLSPAGAAPKDTLVIGVSQFPPNLHPSMDPAVSKTFVEAMAYRPISAMGRSWTVDCFLCDSLPTLENGGAVLVPKPPNAKPGDKQGLRATFHINPKATWADGEPVTSADAKFTWEVGRTKGLGLASPDVFERITAVTPVDEKTFTIDYDAARYDYNDLGDFALLPAHIEAPVIRALAAPGDYGKQTAYNRDPTNPGLWMGPYRIVEVRQGSQITLERNPHWYGKQPAFRRVIVRVIENTAALEANLRSGDLDYVAGELGLSLEQGLALQKTAANRFDFNFPPGLIYEHLDVNLEHPVLKDPKVRQALLMGLDRETLTKRLFEGRQPVAHSFVNPKEPGFDANVRKYPFDPAKAKALLDEAGFKPGAGGIRVAADGRRLSFVLMTTAGNRTRELVEQVLQTQWRDLGAEVVIRNEPARTLFGETLRRRTYDGMALYAWSSRPEAPPITTLRSSSIPSTANGWAGSNYPGFVDPEMDRLIDAVQVELDPTKRQPLWSRIQAIYTDALPVLPLYFRADVFVVPKQLKGVTPSGHSNPTTSWIEEWTWE